jgi:hypothetical protein
VEIFHGLFLLNVSKIFTPSLEDQAAVLVILGTVGTPRQSPHLTHFLVAIVDASASVKPKLLF